ncbi:MAG: LEA type 2 family protein [Cocleimonas sp.]|nr:LEA type 2 family protein [Cocleimonas sp.]
MVKKIITIIALVTFLVGCSSNGLKDLVERPKVSVDNVKMGKLTLSGGSAKFLLKIENPNRFPIPLQGFDYGLRLNGVEVANGSREQKVTIAGGESKMVEVPLVFSFTNMMNLLPNVFSSRDLKYDLKGSIHFPWFNLPFSRSGGTSLSR